MEFTPGGKPVTHGGSGTAYANYGCRCPECTVANAERIGRRRRERRFEPIPDWVQHGVYTTYTNWSCKCDPCKAAGAVKNRETHQRRKARATTEETS